MSPQTAESLEMEETADVSKSFKAETTLSSSRDTGDCVMLFWKKFRSSHWEHSQLNQLLLSSAVIVLVSMSCTGLWLYFFYICTLRRPQLKAALYINPGPAYVRTQLKPG